MSCLTSILLLKTFWEKSVFERPAGRGVACQPSAWDLYKEEDYRINMCAQVQETDFGTAHHEMGHIQYFMHYRNQSFLFRNGANPGFHEGVADVFSIAASITIRSQNDLDWIFIYFSE